MSSLHSIKKAMEKNSLKFPPDMYNNMCGSLVICAYIFRGADKYSLDGIRSVWSSLKKDKDILPCWIDDDKFIEKWLGLFKMKVPEVFPIAMVQSKYNALFLPYVDGKLLPIREDGVMPLTSRCGKIYPISMEGCGND